MAALSKILITLFVIVTLVSCMTPTSSLSPPPGSVNSHEMWVACKLKLVPNVELTDVFYHLPESTNWTQYFPPRMWPYAAERWDCDDYALDAWATARRINASLNTNNTGIAIGFIAFDDGVNGGHAANVVMTAREMFVYDPQRRCRIPWPKDIYFIWW